MRAVRWRRTRWIAPVATAACALVLVFAFPERNKQEALDPDATSIHDINRDGRVDIVDAILLARQPTSDATQRRHDATGAAPVSPTARSASAAPRMLCILRWLTTPAPSTCCSRR